MLYKCNMTNLLTLKTAILNKLNTLTWEGQPLVEVLDYHSIDKTGFPYVSFESSSLESDILDTCSNMRNYIFDIYIYQDITTPWRQQAKEIIDNCFDKICNLFDNDYNLWGLCEGWIIPTNWEFGQFVDGEGSLLFAKISLNCKTIHNIY